MIPETQASANQEPSPTGQCGSLSVIAGSEFLRFHGERPEKYYAPGAERACGNCKHLKPDYSHPCTDGHSILKQRGWICDCPELGCFSGWTTEGCCEYHERLSFPNDEKLLQQNRIDSAVSRATVAPVAPG
jgi:hypothetical protein